MLYEIINPSDPYTLEAEDPAVAAAAVLILGDGRLSLVPVRAKDGEERERLKVPLFLFGGAVEWFEKTYGREFGAFLKERRADVADALDGVVLGAPEVREARFAEWRAAEDEEGRRRLREEAHDRRRSSMNDIGRHAWRMAERLRSWEVDGPEDGGRDGNEARDAR